VEVLIVYSKILDKQIIITESLVVVVMLFQNKEKLSKQVKTKKLSS